MLLLALGREASKAHMDLLEFGRPPGKLRLTGKQIIQAESKCHSNICRAACKCCREVSNMKVKDRKAAGGVEVCPGRMQTFCRRFSSLCVSRICFVCFFINLRDFTHPPMLMQTENLSRRQKSISAFSRREEIPYCLHFSQATFIYLSIYSFAHLFVYYFAFLFVP